MDDERVPIEFTDDIVDTLAEWLKSDDGSVGACLRCGREVLLSE